MLHFGIWIIINGLFFSKVLLKTKFWSIFRKFLRVILFFFNTMLKIIQLSQKIDCICKKKCEKIRIFGLEFLSSQIFKNNYFKLIFLVSAFPKYLSLLPFIQKIEYFIILKISIIGRSEEYFR